MDIFGSAGPGNVAIIAENGKTVPGAVQLNGLTGGGTHPILVSRVGLAMSTNVQFALSLRRVVYVYSLGDRMGKISLSGSAFERVCGSDVGGFKKFLTYYNDNRASKRSTPISISVAGEDFQAYIIAANIAGTSEVPGMFDFSLEMASLAESHTTLSSTPGSGSSSGGGATDNISSQAAAAAAVIGAVTPTLLAGTAVSAAVAGATAGIAAVAGRRGS